MLPRRKWSSFIYLFFTFGMDGFFCNQFYWIRWIGSVSEKTAGGSSVESVSGKIVIGFSLYPSCYCIIKNFDRCVYLESNVLLILRFVYAVLQICNYCIKHQIRYLFLNFIIFQEAILWAPRRRRTWSTIRGRRSRSPLIRPVTNQSKPRPGRITQVKKLD